MGPRALLLAILLTRATVPVEKTYNNVLDFETCRAASVRVPETVEQVQNIVKAALQTGQKVKAVGTRLASTDIACTTGIAVDMSKFQQVEIDEENKTVTVGSGATYEQMHTVLASAGYTVIHPGSKYSGVSVGGGLATATHGSSLVHASTLADQAISMTFVDGRGEVVVATDALLDATAIGLGAMGIVVDVTLRIVPNFKIRMENTRHNDSFITSGEAIRVVREKDYVALNWYPTLGEVIMTSGSYLPDMSPSGNDVANYAFGKNAGSIGFSKRVEEAQVNGEDDFFCASERASADSWMTGVPSVKVFVNETGDFQNPATGTMTKLLTQHCVAGGGCGWENPDAFVSHQVDIAVDVDRLPALITRLKSILSGSGYCFLTLDGIIIRFGKQSDRHISPASQSDVAWLEVVTPLRRDYTLPFYKMDMFAKIYQVMFFEFDGRMHWGKGGNAVFVEPFNPPAKLYPRWEQFLSAKEEFDPEGVFENEFIRRLLGKSSTKKTDYCAVYDQCICTEDRHCPDNFRCNTAGFSRENVGFCQEQ